MKKKLSLRMMSLLLALILTVASIPSVITAEYGIKEEIISNELLNDNGNISNEVINDESLVEDISQRGKFSKNYISRDGSRYLVVFPEQVHYLDAGEWREIDNTLRYDSTTKKYITRNQSFTTGFSADSGSGDLVTITDGEYSLSWSVCFPGADIGDSSFNIQVNSTQGNLGVASSAAQIISVGVGTSSEKKTRGNIESLDKVISCVQYNGVHADTVDLRYTVLHGKVEEDIILNSPNGFTSYTLVVNTGVLTATVNDEGKVSFSNIEGDEIFNIASPWMKDASGEFSNDIEVNVVQRGETAYINYEPSSEWLNEETRSYPVLIDPSFTTRFYTNNYVDTYFYDVADSDQERENYTTMKVGNAQNKTYYPYIKILNVPLDKMYVEEATFTVFTANPIKDQLELHYVSSDWTSQSLLSTLTTNMLPSTSLIAEAENEYFLNADDPDFDEGEISNGKFTFNIANWLNYVVDTTGTYTNDFFSSSSWNGFKLAYVNSNASDGYTSTDIYSSEYSFAGYRPTLTFKYTCGYYSSLEDGAIYSFRNAASDKYLTVDGGNTVNGTNINQYTKNDTLSQAFRLDYVENGNAFLLRAMVSNDGSGSVAHFDYGSSIDKTNGYLPTNLQLKPYYIAQGSSQQWVFEPVEDYGLYKIVAKSDPNLVMTAYGTSNGTLTGTSDTSDGNVFVSEYTGSDSQHWVVETGGVVLNSPLNVKNTSENIPYCELEEGDTWLSFACPVTVFGDTVSWSSTNTNVATVDNEGRITAVGAGGSIITATITHNDSTTEKYSNAIVVLFDEEIYIIKNTTTGRYIEIENLTTESGAFIQQGDINNDLQKHWILNHEYDEYYRIKSYYSGLYVGVDSNNSSIIAQYSQKNDYSLWKIEKTSSGYYKFTCKATEMSGEVLGVPLSYNENGTNLTQITYTSAENSNGEWELHITRDISLVALPENYDRSSYFSDIQEDMETIGYTNCYNNHEFINQGVSKSELIKFMSYSKITLIRTHGSRVSIAVSGDRILKSDIDSLGSNALKYSDLIIYGACSTAAGGKDADNLVNATIGAGARTVIGFEYSVWSNLCNEWCEIFFDKYALYYNQENKTIDDVCKEASDTFVKHLYYIEYDANGNINSSIAHYVIAGEETFPDIQQ